MSKTTVILSKMIFFSSEREVHIFNMPVTFVRSFRLVAEKLYEELIIQTSCSVSARNCKISKSKIHVILSK